MPGSLLKKYNPPLRSFTQRCIDTLTFPLRALTLFETDKWGLSSLASERFDYVARQTKGYCLDIGCGKHNRFIVEYLQGNGKGIDVFCYEGLTKDNIVNDMTHLPFKDASFDSVSIIASINHIPRTQRNAELKEAYRCLRQGGVIIITMGNPLAEILVHKLNFFYTKLLPHYVDMDSQRGMHQDEDYYLTDSEINQRLSDIEFTHIKKKYFLTQWGLNHLFTATK